MGTISNFGSTFLSNFYLIDIEYGGIVYPSIENAFQAQKSLPDNIAHCLKCAKVTPYRSKRLGRRVELRPDWESVKISIMKELLDIKFSNPVMGHYLLGTDDSELIEGNTWKDKFWGVYKGKGENQLGKLLMIVRSELRERGRNMSKKRHPKYPWLLLSQDGSVYSEATSSKLEPVTNGHGNVVVYEYKSAHQKCPYYQNNRYYLADLMVDTFLTLPEGTYRYTLVPDHINGNKEDNSSANLKWRSLIDSVNGEDIWGPIPVTIVDHVKMICHKFPSKAKAVIWSRDNLPTRKIPDIKYSPSDWNVLSYGRYQTIRAGFDDVVSYSDLVSGAICLVNNDADNNIYTFKGLTTLQMLERVFEETSDRKYKEEIIRTEMKARRNNTNFVTPINDTTGICHVVDYINYIVEELGMTEYTIVDHI